MTYQKVKHNIYNWRKSHPERYKQYLKNQYQKNKIKYKVYKKHNNERISAVDRNRTEGLTDGYIKKQLRKQGYLNKDITPDLMEIKRMIILNFRLRKILKNGKQQT